MTDEIERALELMEESEQEWPDEPTIDINGWRRLASLAAEWGMPAAEAGCLAAAGDWPDHRGWFSASEDFDERINAIGEKHGFQSLARHLEVCTALHVLVRTLPSNVETGDGVLRAEKGASSWRDIQRRMPVWLSRTRTSKPDFLYLLALELHNDDTSFAAASMAGVRQRLTALLLQLENIVAASGDVTVAQRVEVTAILEALTEVSAPGGGRHSHGKRRKDCAVLAKEFWEEQSERKPTVAFVPDPTTSPDTPFTKWFCDVMDYIDGWSVVTCNEVLRTRTNRRGKGNSG